MYLIWVHQHSKSIRDFFELQCEQEVHYIAPLSFPRQHRLSTVSVKKGTDAIYWHQERGILFGLCTPYLLRISPLVRMVHKCQFLVRSLQILGRDFSRNSKHLVQAHVVSVGGAHAPKHLRS